VNPSIFLFSIGLVLTMASQLRLRSWPIGVGEGLLFLWICISWVDIVGRKNIRIPADLRPFLFFFVVVVTTLLFSLLFQLAQPDVLYPDTFHDLIAYAFLAILVFTFVMLRPSLDYVRQSLKIVTVILPLLLAVLLVISKFKPAIGPVVLDNGFRFSGLAENPNQIGMALVPIPFLSAFFLRQAGTLRGRLGYAANMVLAVWVGIATHSDATQVAWTAGVMLLVVLALLNKIMGRAHPFYIAATLVAIGVLSLLIVVPTPIGAKLFAHLSADDQGNQRMILWAEAIAEISKSPILGRGPGARTSTAIAGVIEAHNSYLDLALSTGLLGAAVALGLVATLALRASLLARPLLWSAFMALQCFVMFHYVFRHPLLWFYMVLVTALAERDYLLLRRPGPTPATGPVELRLRKA
jgi:O-antigen ligase